MLSAAILVLVGMYFAYTVWDLLVRSRGRNREQDQAAWTLYMFCILHVFNFVASVTESALRSGETRALYSILGLFLVAAKLIVLKWSRTALGHNYQVHAGLVREHELVTSGPYRLVRNPIYVARYLGAIGVPLSLGSYFTLIAVSIMEFVAIWIRARVEEGQMAVRFGRKYALYKKRVGAVLPFRTFWSAWRRGRKEQERPAPHPQ
ncbi:MAG: methyltransferase family protein [Planctomycetota bacterium]|jgi:protein-S-isoprenylcysteine O-methyltransferase Ste14